MTKIVADEDIERIVNARRHPTRHIGRAVSDEQIVYILHSGECKESAPDLRDCRYSQALDRGIDPAEWLEDVPVLLTIEGFWPNGWLKGAVPWTEVSR